MISPSHMPNQIDNVKSSILQVVVDHVQSQFDELADATVDIPGFHIDILPKFAAYVSQLRAKAKELKVHESSENSTKETLRELMEPITNNCAALSISDLKSHLATEALQNRYTEEIDRNLDDFVKRLEERGKACCGDLTNTLRNLKVLNDHVTLVELSNQLRQWTNEKDPKFMAQDKSIRMAQTQLCIDIATLVKASEVDVKKVSAKMATKATDTALSPPTFKETPSPPRAETGSVSRRDRPSVPALWAADVQSIAEKLPPTNVPSRVTLDRRPFKVNIFDDEDDDEETTTKAKEAAVLMKPKAPGHLLSSQLTFRQKGPRVMSPRFGKNEVKGRKAPSNPVTAVKKIAKANPPRRLSLGTKMARRSISTNAWSDD